jgi:hypothetical protein
MGKIGRIARAALRKEFLIGFVGAFVAMLALPSAMLTMLGGHLSIRLTLAMVLLAVSSSVFVNRRALLLGIHWKLPGRRTLRCPSDLQLTRQVAKLAREEFGRETISLSNYEPLRAKNKFILSCLLAANGEFLGYFDVVPLKKNFGELFLQGIVGEHDLTHEHVLGPREMKKCRYVYVSGLAAKNYDSQFGQENAVILMWSLLKYLEHFYGSTDAYAFATAVTGDGEHLLNSFSIPLACLGNQRTNRRNVYGAQLSRDQISSWLSCLPDYTFLCTIDWAKSASTDGQLIMPRRPRAAQKKRRMLHA